jgi:hypothetical protein
MFESKTELGKERQECEAPFQTLIGSMNQQYCIFIFIALGIWLEASLTAFPWAAVRVLIQERPQNSRRGH